MVKIDKFLIYNLFVVYNESDIYCEGSILICISFTYEREIFQLFLDTYL